MKNIKMAVKGNTLTITIDLNKTYGESKSGKSVVIASTEGNQSAPNNDAIKIGINVYKPVTKDE